VLAQHHALRPPFVKMYRDEDARRAKSSSSTVVLTPGGGSRSCVGT
jgi:hypothetical protein